LDSVTLEDWGEEIFAEGVGVKWRKWVSGEGQGKKKILFFPPAQPLSRLCTKSLPVKHPVTIQEAIYPITPALQAIKRDMQ